MLKLKLQYFGHLMWRSWLIGKDSDAGRDWGQEEKGTTEDEMAGWHHWLDRHESEWTLGVGDGQGGLACCVFMGSQRVGHDWATELNWTDKGQETYWLETFKIKKIKYKFLVLEKMANTSSTQTLPWIALIKPGQKDTATVWGFWKVNSSRQIEVENQNPKYHHISSKCIVLSNGIHSLHSGLWQWWLQ